MPRLPFDPNRAAGASAEKPAKSSRRGGGSKSNRGQHKTIADAKPLTVSQTAALIKNTLQRHIDSPIRVVGEVSNLSKRNHWYFSLKDEKAVLGCVAWASNVRTFGFEPSEGDEVVATGEISYYGPQGRTQLYVKKLEPVGAGALEMQFRAMCEQLRKAGYFDPAHKIQTPVFPRRVAVITSHTGAAIQDVKATAAQRCPAVGLVIIDARVQGEGAAEQVARAIQWADHHHERLGIDAILVTRGGGSMEDLWAFNERIVADATYHCRLPIVAAIGHESDTTVIELVADARAATPTQAAMMLVPDRRELNKQVSHLNDRLRFVTRRRVERGRERLEALSRHEAFRDPRLLLKRANDRLIELDRSLRQTIRHRVSHGRIRVETLAGRLAHLHPQQLAADRRERLAVLTDRLHRATMWRMHQRPAIDQLERSLNRAVRIHFKHHRDRLTNLTRHFHAIDPHAVLQRGYSMTHRTDGSLVRSHRDVELGEMITTRLADGELESIIESRQGDQQSTQASPSKDDNPRPNSRAAKQKASNPTDPSKQMDLF